MGKTRYSKIKELLEKLKAEKGEIISSKEFSEAILINIASSPQALRQILLLIKELNMVEERENAVFIR